MPVTREALTRLDVAARLSTESGPSSGPPRVGIEQEWHTYPLHDPRRHLRPEEVLAAVEAGDPLPFGSRVTIEPGGQVELATPAMTPWPAALVALRVDGGVLRASLARAGIAAVGAGADPFREPVRTLRRPRYDAMEAYFDRGGPAGRRMMCGTASIQVNVDNGEAHEVDARWRLAHHVAPALAAAFACSPDRGHRSARLGVWAAMDPTRTRPALRGGGLADDWTAFVLDARVMLLHDDQDRCRPMEEDLTFGQWIDQGIAGRRPTEEDLAYHCTTLFPPVRSRGWLELRWLDALPAGLADAAVAAVVGLLTDPQAAERAAHVTASVADCWSEAATVGPRHPALAGAAATLLRDAAEALDRVEGGALHAEVVADAADRWPARGRCPADDLEDRLRRGHGVAELADPAGEVLGWR
jgi:glutamate--cysteine ligase